MRRRFYRKPRRSRRLGRRILAVLVLLAVVYTVLFVIYNNRMRPILETIAVSDVEDYATECINLVVSEFLSDGEYGNIIDVRTDSYGTVKAITTDMTAINKLKSGVALKVLSDIEGYINDSEIMIPLGAVTDIELFSAMGPDIPVKILPVTSVYANAESRLSEAGINQTLYRVVLSVSVAADIVISGDILPAFYEVDVVVAETVIVGTVPQVYALTK